MIHGLGIDIVEIERMKKSLSRVGFTEKVFSASEINYCEGKANTHESYAGKFAAKEALIKAMGVGIFSSPDLCHIEVTNDKSGKPGIKLHEEFLKLYPELKKVKLHLSISHATTYAAAVVVIEE